MKVFAVANQKGGVGKTTTTISLASLACARGGRQLLVDLDPHGSLTSYLGHDPETSEGGVYALFEAARAGAEPSAIQRVVPTGIDRLDLLPASTALATLERRLGSLSGMGRVVEGAVKSLARDYENVWIDCPPMLGILMINALCVCDRLLIPVQTEYLALKGLERMMASLKLVENSRGTTVPYTIVPTLFDRRTRASVDSLSALERRHGDHLAPEPIPIDTQFRMASEQGLPLPDTRPGARGVVAYRSLLEELLPQSTFAGQVGEGVA